MAELRNLTPFAATTLPSMSFDDRQLMVVVVAGRFHMPLPRSHHREPTISEHQPPVPLADEWRGSPGASSPRPPSRHRHRRHLALRRPNHRHRRRPRPTTDQSPEVAGADIP